LEFSQKLLGTSLDMQIVDDSTVAKIEEILAYPPIASTSALPPTNMGKRGW
jgi:hypothetical protein